MPEEITPFYVIVFLMILAAIIAITYFLYRWIFDVDKHTKQNNAIIGLLTKIAEKQGVTNEEIHSATNVLVKKFNLYR